MGDQDPENEKSSVCWLCALPPIVLSGSQHRAVTGSMDACEPGHTQVLSWASEQKIPQRWWFSAQGLFLRAVLSHSVVSDLL